MKAISESPSGKYLNVNDSFADFFGYDKDKMIGKTAVDLNMYVNPEERVRILRDLQEYGFAREVEIKVISRDNEVRWVSTNIDKINLNGKDCFLTAAIDITHRKDIEEKLLVANEELEAFSYSVSHDLRAPLRAVSGYALMLEEDYNAVLDDEGRRLLKVVQGNANRMGLLIDELLTFSRLGRKEVIRSYLKMNDIVKSVWAEINNTTINKAEIKIYQLDDIMADSALIKQVIINLLSNAVKYSSKKENPFIEIQSEKKKEEVIYSVSDNGAGFDMDYIDKLFGVFQRLHFAEEFDGNGVGLALVRRIINKHGGRVWAQGAVDKGATFYFSIPLKNIL